MGKMENTFLNRRRFLQHSAAGVTSAALAKRHSLHAANKASNKLRVGVMGLGRGMAHVRNYLKLSDVEVVYVCDVDDNRTANGLSVVTKSQAAACRGITDLRRMLDDPHLDAISIAAPNFWHAPATILGCQAGKHVYVEKPGSHNAAEAGLMVAAARKHNRLVQMGNQRRSYPLIIEAVQRMHEGVIGRILSSRSFYSSGRGSIGKGKPAPVPKYLNYDLWQGPAPERPYKDNLIPYNWHWHWHYGGGEMANNGVHALDLARWGLGVDLPKRVTYGGGRYHFDDDQESPDTGTALFDFGNCTAMWDQSSCLRRKHEALPFVVFYGDNGTLTMTTGNKYIIHDLAGKEVETNSQPASDILHFTNFVNAIRNGEKLNAEIGNGQVSTLLCHLANMAWRSGSTVDFDPAKRSIVDNSAAGKLWAREYRPGWEPQV